MEQSDADRAAVAREVLTELEQHFRDDPLQGLGATAATVVKWFRDEHYPAPPAPETVTVDGVTYERRDDICQGGWYAFGTTIWPDEWKGVALTRIASDARGIRERDARIAELEQLLLDQPRLLYDSMWQAIDRMGDAVGTLTGPGSNCHVTATRVCETIETLESERDAALRALEEAKGAIGAALAELTSRKNDKHRAQYAYDALAPFEGKGLGKINGAEQAPAEEPSPATVDAAPAPIPPGADEKPFDQTMDAKLWAQEFVRRFPAHDEGLMLAWFANAIMRGYDTARAKYDHPVATRETVERVVTILRKQAWSSVPFTHRAEEILTAAGFTLEAGA